MTPTNTNTDKSAEEIIKKNGRTLSDGSFRFYIGGALKAMIEYGELRAEAAVKKSMEERWITVVQEDESTFPEIGICVIVETLILSHGKTTKEVFAGYLDENGELITLPEDDGYGWDFKDCVARWKLLVLPPSITA